MKKLILLFGMLVSAYLVAQTTPTVNVLTSVSCFSPATGGATLTVTGGGTPPYSYSVIPSTYSTSVGGVFHGLNPGAYTYVVCDALFHCATGTFVISPITPPTLTVTYAPSGLLPFLYLATATISGGTAPYYTVWSSNIMGPIKSHTVHSSIDTAYLYPGDYTISIQDSLSFSNGCSGVGSLGTYSFSICDPAVASGNISILPNDTLCSGATFTVQYTPVLLAPVYIVNSLNFSSDPSCMPPNAPVVTWTCVAAQTTTFTGQWFYAMGCSPVAVPPAVLVVQNCTNVQSITNLSEDFKLYPNPSNGMLHINSDTYSGMVAVQITDVTGKLIMNKEIDLNKNIFLDLPDGIYYLNINTNNTVRKYKLVILK